MVALLHGGFWRAKYTLALMDPLCRDLVERGWTAWNLEYRRAPEGQPARWPDLLLDVAAGLDHLPAALDGEPPGPVVVVGHSAGGHLALWAAARAGLPAGAPGADPALRPDAVAGQAAVADLRAARAANLGRGAVHELLGAPDDPAELERRLALASPVERLPLGVPLLLVHGDADPDVPPAMSRDIADRARRAGDEVELRMVEDTGHFEHLEAGSPAWAAVLDWLGRRAERRPQRPA